MTLGFECFSESKAKISSPRWISMAASERFFRSTRFFRPQLGFAKIAQFVNALRSSSLRCLTFVFNLGWRMFGESRGAGCFALTLMYDNSSKSMETQSWIHPVRKCDSDTLFRLPASCFRFLSDETRSANVCERRRLRGQTRQEVVKNICHEMQTHWITSDFPEGGLAYPTPSVTRSQPRIPSHFDSFAAESHFQCSF